MAGSIEIRNLRNISKLRFEIPDRGVWLLTAGNGAGKTSLLACIRRIGYSNAFPAHFPNSLRSTRLDNHSKGSVTYEINGDSVEYAYRGERWTPRPRSNANLLARFGYPSVTYMGATGDRITPRPEDFEPGRVRSANRSIVNSANKIFDTTKFNDLRTVNLARGVGNDAFVLSVGTNPSSYHSEKHFSLGELCVLKLLKLLHTVENNSMIIVDELEMALHPKAQVRLLEYLDEQSTQKSLTVIFSTHSVTLLKVADRRRIIYLDRQEDGEIKPIVGCYPTYAIGNIAYDEETTPDGVGYVEDLFAKDIVSAFLDQYLDERFNDPSVRPTIKVLPVGGFKEVVAFLDQNRAVLPGTCRQMALLDGDVAQETIVAWRANHNPRLAKFDRLAAHIAYLPWAPEVGVMSYLKANLGAVEQALRVRFRDNQIRLGASVAGFDDTLAGGQLRRSAKTAVDSVLDYLCQKVGRTPEAVQDELCREFAKLSWQQYRPDLIPILVRLTG